MKTNSKRAIWILISAAFCFAGAAAAFASDAPATQPATQPVSPEIAALIKQLGDDDFHVRQGATSKLEAMGNAAIPALQEARKSSDPEVHTRAEAYFWPTARDHHRPRDLLFRSRPGFGIQSVKSSVANGKRIVDVEEPGRKTHIEESGNGIKMKVDGQIDGKPVTREYKANNAEELKEKRSRCVVPCTNNAMAASATRSSHSRAGRRRHHARQCQPQRTCHSPDAGSTGTSSPLRPKGRRQRGQSQSTGRADSKTDGKRPKLPTPKRGRKWPTAC